MNNFEDLQEMAADPAHKKQHRGFWILLFSYPLFMLSLMYVLCLGMIVVMGWEGWGMLGGIATLLAMLTLPVFFQEIRYLIKGE